MFSPDKEFSKKETRYNYTQGKVTICYPNKYRRLSHKARNSSELQQVLANQTTELMKVNLEPDYKPKESRKSHPFPPKKLTHNHKNKLTPYNKTRWHSS